MQKYPKFDFSTARGPLIFDPHPIGQLVEPDPEVQAIHDKAYQDIARQTEALRQEREAALVKVEAERQKLLASLTHHQKLASATQQFLSDAKELLVEGKTATQNRRGLAAYARDLRGLADEYGLRIVKVGNGTWATLVRK